uniref:Uncharacterized protein n=1 Tax=Arundo donax TaxID=35708 RepID=A0A0A9FVH3_ARUDO
MGRNKTEPDITRTEVEKKRILKSLKPKCWEIIKTTRECKLVINHHYLDSLVPRARTSSCPSQRCMRPSTH